MADRRCIAQPPCRRCAIQREDNGSWAAVTFQDSCAAMDRSTGKIPADSRRPATLPPDVSVSRSWHATLLRSLATFQVRAIKGEGKSDWTPQGQVMQTQPRRCRQHFGIRPHADQSHDKGHRNSRLPHFAVACCGLEDDRFNILEFDQRIARRLCFARKLSSARRI